MEKLLLAGLVVMTSVIGAVHADDKSDVQAVFDAMVAANNANDMDKEQALYLPEATGFAENGGPLEADFNWDRAREIIKNGGKWGFKYGKTDIAVHGSTAVVTGYRKGYWQTPDGFKGEGMGRFTYVLSKQEGDWKCVHRHYSHGVFIPVEQDE